MAKFIKNFYGDTTLDQLGDNFTIMENSQDIAAVQADFPDDIPEDATLVAVDVEDGEYGEVYCSVSSTPYLSDTPMIKVK